MSHAGWSSDRSTVCLTVLFDNGAQRQMMLAAGRVMMVGRSAKHSFQVEAPGVADTHCMLALRDDGVHVRDWNSETGTYLNNQRLDDEVVAQPGDVIRIGECRIAVPSSKVCLTDSTVMQLHKEDLPKPTTQVGLDGTISFVIESIPSFEQSSTAAAEKPQPVAGGKQQHIQQSAEDEDFSSWNPDLNEEPNPLGDWLGDAGGAHSHRQGGQSDHLTDDVEFLRQELAERELRIAELESLALYSSDEQNAAHAGDDPATLSGLATRLDQVLDELEKSDERILLLSDLLRRSEEACLAADEERGQIEVWIGDIERLFSARESEWQAERESLKRRISQLSQQPVTAPDTSLQSAGQGGSGKQNSAELTLMRNALQAAEEESLDLKRQLEHARMANSDEAWERRVEAAVREERLQLAEANAEIARLRAELPAAVMAAQSTKSDPRQADFKIRAFREHLREIHASDPQAPGKNANVSQRLGKLWRKLNGTPLDTD